MPFLMALLGVLETAMGSLVGRVLLALGMSFVTYKGFDVSTGFLMDSIKSNMSQMPVDILNFLAFLWVDKAIAMVFSTWAACAGVKGLAGGITKLKMSGAA